MLISEVWAAPEARTGSVDAALAFGPRLQARIREMLGGVLSTSSMFSSRAGGAAGGRGPSKPTWRRFRAPQSRITTRVITSRGPPPLSPSGVLGSANRAPTKNGLWSSAGRWKTKVKKSWRRIRRSPWRSEAPCRASTAGAVPAGRGLTGRKYPPWWRAPSVPAGLYPAGDLNRALESARPDRRPAPASGKRTSRPARASAPHPAPVQRKREYGCVDGSAATPRPRGAGARSVRGRASRIGPVMTNGGKHQRQGGIR